jgi:hypothetical protein
VCLRSPSIHHCRRSIVVVVVDSSRSLIMVSHGCLRVSQEGNSLSMYDVEVTH